MKGQTYGAEILLRHDWPGETYEHLTATVDEVTNFLELAVRGACERGQRRVRIVVTVTELDR